MVGTYSQRATSLSAFPLHPQHPPQTNGLRPAQSNQNSTNCILICFSTGPIRNLIFLFCNTLLGNFLLAEVSEMVWQGKEERHLKSLAEGQCPLQPGSGSDGGPWRGRSPHFSHLCNGCEHVRSPILSGGGQLPWHRDFNDVMTLWGL